jgi:hypothetical protein
LHLEFTEQPYAEAAPGGMLRLKSSFTVRLDSKSDEDEVDLRVRIGCPILEDEGQEGDDLGLKVAVQGAKAIVDKEDPLLYRFSLAKGDKIKFKIESEPYDTAWTVRLRPDINREQL